MTKSSYVSTRLKITAVTVFAVSLLVNGLANTTVLGGDTTAQVSDSYPNLFAPAGVTFSIWGVIYTLLIVFCVRLFLRSANRTGIAELLVPLTKQFIAVTVLNTLWLLTWQYRVLWLSVVIMIGMLLILIRMTGLIHDKKFNALDWVTVKLPFSIYFGWINVALIANSTAFLVSINWNGWGISDQAWTMTILIIGVLIALLAGLKHRDFAYVAVFVWAYFGILLKHKSAQDFDGTYPSIINALYVLIAILTVSSMLIALKMYKNRLATGAMNSVKTSK